MFALGLAALPWPELLAGGSTRVILTFAGQLLLVPALLKRLPFRLRAVSLTLALLLFLSPAVVVAPGFNVLMTAGTAVLMSRIFLGARGMAAVGGMVALMLALTWQRTDLAGAAGQQMQWSNLSAFMAGVSTMCWVVLTTFDRIAEARARTRRLLDDVHDERRSRDWMLRQAEAAEDRERRQQAESLIRLVGAELSRAKAPSTSIQRR
jgi:membrane-bound ClpP family serine protease